MQFPKASLPPLHVMQANTWQQIAVAGSKPTARDRQVAAWSDAADGLYIHGGYDGTGVGAQEVRRVGDQRLQGFLDDLWFFSRQAGCGMEREHGVPSSFFYLQRP